ncbi:MAG: ankyrin repeat domain-containing protein [Phycisphaerae bacterium]
MSLAITGLGVAVITLARAPQPSGIAEGINELVGEAVSFILWLISFLIALLASTHRLSRIRKNTKAVLIVVMALSVIAPLGCWIWFLWRPTQVEFVTAVAWGDMAKVKRGVWLGLPLNAPAPHAISFGGRDPGQTALTSAANIGRLEIAQYLIQRGANVNTRDGRGILPLSAAARAGHLPLVELFLAHGADVNGIDKGPIGTEADGTTALHWAARGGEVQIAERLLTSGADPNLHAGPYQYTPLQEALEPLVVHGDQRAVARIIAEHGGNPRVADSQNRTPASIAAERGYDDVLKALTSHAGATPADRLMAAIAAHDDATAIDLLKQNSELSRRTSMHTLLNAAVHARMKPLTAYLISHGANPASALASAVDTQDEDILVLLSDNQPERWNYVLWDAARAGRLSTAEIAVRHGANPKTLVRNINKIRETPLHAAAAGGHLDIIQFLLDHGADVNAVDEDPFNTNPDTPLDEAVLYNKPDALRLLAQHGGVGHHRPGNSPVLKDAGLTTNADYMRVFGDAK